MKKRILSSTLVALTGVSQAALISWSTPADATNENVIISPATVVQAYNVGGPALTVTVGGTDVVFADNSGATGVAANLSGGANINATYWQGSAGDIDFDTILDSQRWNSAAGSHDITLSGLMGNTTYQVQVFSIDNRGGNSAGRYYTLSDGVTTSAEAGRDTAGGTGQFIVGTFTTGPAETTQTFSQIGYRSAGTDNGSSQLNAVVVAVVPEPSSALLLSLAGFALLGRRSRK
ncbi:MAG: PEP-CTERM sorting domain-containing protein [Akkermansiaceae bacterium]